MNENRKSSPWRVPVFWLVIGLPVLSIVAGVGLVVVAARSGGADVVSDPVQRVSQIQTADLGMDETAQQLILIIQPEVGQDIVSIRLIHIGSRSSNRFPAHHISLGIYHLIIIGYSHKGMMTVFQSMGFSHLMIIIYCVHRQIYHLPLSVTCEECDIGMQRLPPLCFV